jgi:xanthine dehydrogenase accessory factor
VRDVLDTLERWKQEDKKVAIATVVRTERSAPRDPGAVMALSEDGDVVGSVSGGCVEPAVYEEAMQVLETGRPKLLTYGIADDQAFEVGLTCGGTIHVFVERLDW